MTLITDDDKQPPVNGDCVALLDACLDLAVGGKVQAVALVMVTAPGIYRVTAAGTDIDGMHAGAKQLVAQLGGMIAKADNKTGKPALTVLHNTLKR